MEALKKIQQELKAPKSQYNKFGKYKYRSCEDILEAVKPLLNGCTLTLSDEIVEVGGRVYVKATASLIESETSVIKISAFARESESKKGMDESQITGTASSYARKYALNGLFLIDDTKDNDTNEHKEELDNISKLPPLTLDARKRAEKALEDGTHTKEEIMEHLNKSYDCTGFEL